jgi:hypothetical protein
MKGSAIGGAIGARPLSATAGTSGRANDDEEGRYEVYGRTCTGTGTELRTDLRAFHGAIR